MDQIYRAILQTRTNRMQLQQDHNHSLEQVASLQAQLDQSQDYITKLEAQVGQGQDPVAQLEAQLICGVEQDQDSDWRQKEELESLRVGLQRSQSRNGYIQHKLVSTSWICKNPDQNLILIEFVSLLLTHTVLFTSE